MSIEYVDEALTYFSDYQTLLGNELRNEVQESILFASDEGRLRFMQAMLDTIIRTQHDIPDAVILGGLRAVIDPTATLLPYSLFSETTGEPQRREVLWQMRKVFAEIFARRCDPNLVHNAINPISPWNLLCFMWWELLPRHGVPRVSAFESFDFAALSLMGELVELDHVACQEAALHGLALWQCAYPDEVQRIIKQHAPTIPAELQNYASKAMTGDLM